jgi:hypothetical protein
MTNTTLVPIPAELGDCCEDCGAPATLMVPRTVWDDAHHFFCCKCRAVKRLKQVNK